jgi:hypothetical protein
VGNAFELHLPVLAEYNGLVADVAVQVHGWQV